MKRVLIIDDAATVRLFHRSILEACGYQVDEAVNGIEALEKVLHTGYELYLVDVNMPVQDGYSFLRQLRALPVKQVPALMISTEAALQDREQAWLAGANFYLTKPVKAQALSDVAVLLSGGVQ